MQHLMDMLTVESPGLLVGRGNFIGSVSLAVDTPSFSFRRMRGSVPAREVPRHVHDTAYFFIVLRGRYATEAQNARDLCGPMSVIFNPTGTTHRDHFVDRDGLFLAISVPAELEREIEPSISVSTALTRPDVVKTIGATLQEIDTGGASHDPFALEGLGLQLIAACVPDRRRPSRQAPGWLMRVCEHLRDVSAGPLSVARLATDAGVHPVHLARVFRRHHGCSPGQYIRAWRVQKAKRLIAASAASFSDIASIAGFCDQSHLTHDFKSVTGLTPGQYRRRFGR
jgi:AraC family transcriptional regulator